MRIRRKSVNYYPIYILLLLLLLLLSINSFSQVQNNFNSEENSFEDTHLKLMLNFLIHNKFYDEIGIDYVYSHYKDRNQAFFYVKDLCTKEYGFYSYIFYTGEAHSAEFIMLINEKIDNVVILGYGDYNSNEKKLINFLKNIDLKNALSDEKLINIMIKKLKLIY